MISFEDFQKLDIRIAKVIKVEEIEGADKLLKLTLDAGEDLGERTVAAGIKEWYDKKDFEGKQIVYLANLEPREIRGVRSEGMLLAATDITEKGDRKAVILQPEEEVAPGTKVT